MIGSLRNKKEKEVIWLWETWENIVNVSQRTK